MIYTVLWNYGANTDVSLLQSITSLRSTNTINEKAYSESWLKMVAYVSISGLVETNFTNLFKDFDS